MITDLASFMPQVCMSPMALLVDNDDDDDDDVKDKLWYVIEIEGNIWFDLLVFILHSGGGQ